MQRVSGENQPAISEGGLTENPQHNFKDENMVGEEEKGDDEANSSRKLVSDQKNGTFLPPIQDRFVNQKENDAIFEAGAEAKNSHRDDRLDSITPLEENSNNNELIKDDTGNTPSKIVADP